MCVFTRNANFLNTCMSNDTNTFTVATTDPKLLILVYVLSDPLKALIWHSCQCGLCGQRCIKENLLQLLERTEEKDQWFIAWSSVDF